MNRTVQTSRIKLTIFFVTSFFAMTLLMQSTAYGRVPPIVRTPRTVPVATPTPLTIVKPVNPNLRDRSLDLKPDLQISDIQMDVARCSFKVLVANTGLVDAGAFDVWLNLGDRQPKQAKTMDRLERNKDAWLSFDFTFVGYDWNGAQPGSCPLKGGSYPAAAMGGTTYVYFVNQVHAVADARYLKIIFPPGKQGFAASELIKSGSKDKDGNGNPVTVSEPRVTESNESNNELVMQRADIKPYTAPPLIRRP